MLDAYRNLVAATGGRPPARDEISEGATLIPFCEYWIKRPLRRLFGKEDPAKQQ